MACSRPLPWRVVDDIVTGLQPTHGRFPAAAELAEAAVDSRGDMFPARDTDPGRLHALPRRVSFGIDAGLPTPPCVARHLFFPRHVLKPLNAAASETVLESALRAPRSSPTRLELDDGKRRPRS
jgi:hypothetical protein